MRLSQNAKASDLEYKMQEKPNKLFNILYPIFIFAVAFFIRIYNIDLLPINHDEAHWARALLYNPEFFNKIAGIPVISFPFIPYSLKLFLIGSISSSGVPSLNEFMLYVRLQPVVIGAATVLLVYILAKQMYGRRTAIISSLLLCFLPWHIIHSRIMGRVIWVPFFGCLIFLILYKAIKEKKRIWAGLWFLLSCFLLKESLRHYQAALLFVPIFFVILILVKKDTDWRKNTGVLLAYALTFVIFLLPFTCSLIAKGNKFWEGFFRVYQKNIFEGNLLLNIFSNFSNNAGLAFKVLFFNFSGSSLLYGKALEAPLLVYPLVSLFFVAALIISFCRRKTSDKILLAWLFLGFFGAMAGVCFFQPRYILIILPPSIILIARLIAEIFNRAAFLKRPAQRRCLSAVGITLCLGLVAGEITQWARYYYSAPFHFEECRSNSYGCKEASEYLSRISDIKDYDIMADTRMTVDVYLKYYLLSAGKINRYYDLYSHKSEKDKFYVLWAPESHSRDYWDGMLRHNYDFFKQKHPDAILIKTIYYPNGLAAIHILKVENTANYLTE